LSVLTQTKIDKVVGLGAEGFKIAIYFENRPQITEYLELDELRPMQGGELDFILAHTSNNWRKLFNCFAKLVFALKPEDYASWQQLRDQSLLDQNSHFALLFSKPDLTLDDTIHIISGRTYAAKLNLPCELIWLTPQFAMNKHHKIIVSPYFDYRQLSNERLTQLVKLIQLLSN